MSVAAIKSIAAEFIARKSPEKHLKQDFSEGKLKNTVYCKSKYTEIQLRLN